MFCHKLNFLSPCLFLHCLLEKFRINLRTSICTKSPQHSLFLHKIRFKSYTRSIHKKDFEQFFLSSYSNFRKLEPECDLCHKRNSKYLSYFQRTDGYSGSDIRLLCKEAAMRKVRKIFDLLESHQAGGNKIVCERIFSQLFVSPNSFFLLLILFFSLCSFALLEQQLGMDNVTLRRGFGC